MARPKKSFTVEGMLQAELARIDRAIQSLQIDKITVEAQIKAYLNAGKSALPIDVPRETEEVSSKSKKG